MVTGSGTLLTMSLNQTQLKNLAPKATLYRVADANGLCLEVSPNGAKIWRYRYRFAGTASMVALGKYPAVSLLDARRKRDEARALLVAGVNPAANMRAQR